MEGHAHCGGPVGAVDDRAMTKPWIDDRAGVHAGSGWRGADLRGEHGRGKPQLVRSHGPVGGGCGRESGECCESQRAYHCCATFIVPLWVGYEPGGLHLGHLLPLGSVENECSDGMRRAALGRQGHP